MDSNFPQDLLDLKNRIDHWRLTRRFVREALPAELREAIIQILSPHPVSLIKKALKLDPYRFRTSSVITSSAARPATTVQRIDFVPLTHPALPSTVESTCSSLCQIRIDRRDGSNILITVPPSNSDIIRNICSDFLSGASR